MELSALGSYLVYLCFNFCPNFKAKFKPNIVNFIVNIIHIFLSDLANWHELDCKFIQD